MALLNPTDRLTATLEVQQWNQVLALLWDGGILPYRVAAPMIQALTEQLNGSQPRPDNIVSMGEKA